MVRFMFQKVGMTTVFTEVGVAKAVTVMKAIPTKVMRYESLKDGRKLAIVQYQTDTKKRPSRGWLVEGTDPAPQGEVVPLPNFEVGQKIKVTGHSKGRGFQDAMTRHGFAGGPASHGSRFHRAPGSVGMRTEPGRTPKGKRLPGQDGGDQISVKNCQVAFWSAQDGLLAVVGGVPGPSGAMVLV